MGWLNKLGFGNLNDIAPQTRALYGWDGSLKFTGDSYRPIAGGGHTESGVNINPETAMLHSAVYAAVNIISDTVSMMPRSIMIQTAQGDRQDKTHPYHRILKTEPSPFYTWQSLLKTWVANTLRWGNGYLRIHRNGIGRAVQFQILEHGDVQPFYTKVNGEEKLWYWVFGVMLPPRDVLHISCLGNDGVIGKSPITLAREAIGLGMAASETLSKFYKGGMKGKAVFTNPDTLDDESFQNLKGQIRENYKEDFFLLEGGTIANSLQISPNDAETLATRMFQIEDIGRMYRVPLTKLGVNLKTSAGNSLADQNIDFETDCILPWTMKIEAELNRKLLLPNEKEFLHFNLDESHVRGMDLVKRADYYHKRWLTGSITSNEIRLKEGELTQENDLMDTAFAQSGTIPMDRKYWNNKLITKELNADE
jgi:HK97 family phage portal protein